MKLTTTIKNNEPSTQSLHRNGSRPTPQGVTVEFLPHLGWQVEVGRQPTKVFPHHLFARDKALVNGYKRPSVGSRLTHVFVPVGLVIDAKQQRAERRYMSAGLRPKSPTKP